MKVKDIGEAGLLKRLQSFCPPAVVGDDAAIIPTTQEGKKLVVTTDMLVEGVHFSDRTTSPRDTGWRATAANLSDIAAMGASPMGIAIALGITGDTEVSWIEALYQGIRDCLQPDNRPIVGGDVARAPLITIAITAFGEVDPNRAILRSHCQPGNVIVATGVHGSSRAGLELLLNPELGAKLLEAERCYLVNAHQRPRPRLDVLPVLWSLVESQADILIGGMDSSDGLADAIVQMCRASKVGARIERDRIPISSALKKLAYSRTSLRVGNCMVEDLSWSCQCQQKIGQQLVYQQEKVYRHSRNSL